MFVQVLSSMEADDQVHVDGVDSVEDYSTMWTNLIDRGGLYHIKDEVRLLIVCTAGTLTFFMYRCIC